MDFNCRKCFNIYYFLKNELNLEKPKSTKMTYGVFINYYFLKIST